MWMVMCGGSEKIIMENSLACNRHKVMNFIKMKTNKKIAIILARKGFAWVLFVNKTKIWMRSQQQEINETGCFGRRRVEHLRIQSRWFPMGHFLCSHYQKKKDEGKEKWKVSQTEVESANKRSNKHNDHHLRDVFIAIMFCCNLTLSLGGEGEEPLFCLIVNFHPSVSLVGSPTRSYFPTDFLSSPSNVNREHS